MVDEPDLVGNAGLVVVRPVALALIVFGLGVSGPAAAWPWGRAPLEGDPDAPVWTGWFGAGGGARQPRARYRCAHSPQV